MALTTATGKIENEDPMKIKLVVNICHMTYFLLDKKQEAVGMASEYYSFIKDKSSKEALLLKTSIEEWTNINSSLNSS